MKRNNIFALAAFGFLNILISSSTFSTEYDPAPPQHNSKVNPSLRSIEELPEAENDTEAEWDDIKPLLRQINFGGNWQELITKENQEFIDIEIQTEDFSSKTH